ncbi:hypothetical protein L2E82_44620 [Cichorium intybus]|uniref:Uncharacterized protein n=1 Tax=Cichorium intybus TaxID=13427 RepID=A0ACB8ZQB0_CICIN|nr:hypothetical protein L2E82_44620 [Cichorium intybus]
MGRIGEVISRTWQTAHKMKLQRGAIDGNIPENDNLRIKRFIAKYTINPAIANGFSDYVGSVEVGKLADFVIWKPSFFGAKKTVYRVNEILVITFAIHPRSQFTVLDPLQASIVSGHRRPPKPAVNGGAAALFVLHLPSPLDHFRQQ